MTDSDGGAKTSIRVLGLVNAAAPLSLEQQRRTLMDAGCGYAFEVPEAAGSDKKVGDLLRRLGPGSRLVLTGLGALNRSIAECLWLAANLLEAGVEICIVDQHSARTLAPGHGVAHAMRMAAAFAGQAKARSSTASGRPSTGEVLSPIQVRFARKLYAAGESPRTIGQICRASPRAVMAAIERER